MPHGTESETGETCLGDWASRPVSVAIISLVRRPPASVELGHGSGLVPPHEGAVTSACQYTTSVPSGDHAGSARPFQSGSQMLPLPGVASSFAPQALSCWPW